MEVADVRKRLLETLGRAKKAAAERRARSDAAERAYEGFLSRTAVPLVRQIANALRAEGYAFTVFTPGGSVRLSSDKSGDDFIELFLDTTGDGPRITGHTSRTRGRHHVDAEHIVGSGDPDTVTEEELLAFLMKELEPFVER